MSSVPTCKSILYERMLSNGLPLSAVARNLLPSKCGKRPKPLLQHIALIICGRAVNRGFEHEEVWGGSGACQTSEDVALQSSLDWCRESGAYLGMWSSNIDCKNGSSQLELDVCGGYASEYEGINYGFGLDVRYFGNDVDSQADADRVVFTLSRAF